MVDAAMDKPRGRGGEGEWRLHTETFSAQDADTLTVEELTEIVHAWANSPVDSAHVANVDESAGNADQLDLELLDASDGSAITSDENVDIFAVGRV